MHQFRNLFNATRIPQYNEDMLKTFWKTEAEGKVPTHAIVFRNGHIFKISFLDANDEPLPSPVYEKVLKRIKDEADSLPPGPGVGALTFDKRDLWTKNRETLLQLGNKDILDLIESAMFIVVSFQFFFTKKILIEVFGRFWMNKGQ